MNIHKYVDIILWVLLVLVLIASIIEYTQVAQLKENNEALREYTRHVEEQTQGFRERTINLQERVNNLSKTASQLETAYSACLLRIPEGVEAPQIRTSEDVLVSEQATVIRVADLIPGIIGPTNSMYPLLSANTTVLEKKPESEEELYIGDIIIYEYKDTRIIHRIIDIGFDKQGWYATTKGDNNPKPDPDPVRFEQVRGVLVGIIY